MTSIPCLNMWMLWPPICFILFKVSSNGVSQLRAGGFGFCRSESDNLKGRVYSTSVYILCCTWRGAWSFWCSCGWGSWRGTCPIQWWVSIGSEWKFWNCAVISSWLYKFYLIFFMLSPLAVVQGDLASQILAQEFWQGNWKEVEIAKREVNQILSYHCSC